MKRKLTAVVSLILAAAMMASCGAQNKKDNKDKSQSSSQAQKEESSEEKKDSSKKEESDKEDSKSDSTDEKKTEETKEDKQEEALPPSVKFSAQSGVYPEEFELTLEALEEGEIYYTTDGSDPASSESAVKYEGAVKIAKRDGEKNVVSAVDPLLISANFNSPDRSRKAFTIDKKAPEDGAVDKITVVRAAVKKSDGSFAQSSASTYFIGTPEEHIQGLAESCKAAGQDLAVVSISMNYDDLFDPAKGIYVKGDTFDAALEAKINKDKRVKDGEEARQLDANYKQRGKEWERAAAISFMEFNADGSETVMEQTCGIRVQGNYSRSDLQKGFRLYARTEYGDNNFRYAVFGEDYKNDSGEVMDKFDTLILRAGGNCAFTAKFNDTYWQSLVEESACETKKSRPCVVYLNGEYWGLYVLEEDYTNDYFEDLHGVDKSQVIVYKGDAEAYASGYTLDEGKLPEGKREGYFLSDLNEFFRSHSDAASDEDYAELCKLVDPQSVMDYFAVECWINNKWDWPGKNWSMWKTDGVDESNPYADGRWRLMFYDVEFGGVSGESDAYTNTIKEDNYKPKGLLDMDTKNPAVLSFAYLMTNEGFRKDFEARLEGLSSGEFEKEAALKRLEEFENIYSPLFDQFFERYPGTGSMEEALTGGYASSDCIRQFREKRADNISKQIDFIEKE
ncbi:MAG: CotH kinase family protein, partial [Ruminococcus sp.]|nr:CotH kinase family protein [Ruminococcus sp.]